MPEFHNFSGFKRLFLVLVTMVTPQQYSVKVHNYCGIQTFLDETFVTETDINISH